MNTFLAVDLLGVSSTRNLHKASEQDHAINGDLFILSHLELSASYLNLAF